MQTVDISEAKTHFSALLESVEKGEQVFITKHGDPVAKLIPVKAINHANVKQTIKRLQKFGQSNLLGDLNWKELRDKGRK